MAILMLLGGPVLLARPMDPIFCFHWLEALGVGVVLRNELGDLYVKGSAEVEEVVRCSLLPRVP